MPFTDIQKAKFIALLETKGWEFREGTVWSPRRGLWFDDAHFAEWSPADLRDLFARRAARLERYEHTELSGASGENLQASWAAGEIMKDDRDA